MTIDYQMRRLEMSTGDNVPDYVSGPEEETPSVEAPNQEAAAKEDVDTPSWIQGTGVDQNMEDPSRPGGGTECLNTILLWVKARCDISITFRAWSLWE
jgi:hypothetical protein